MAPEASHHHLLQVCATAILIQAIKHRGHKQRGKEGTDLALVGRDWGRQGLLKALPGLLGREAALERGESALLAKVGMPIISATSLRPAASARSRDRLLDSLLICTFCNFCNTCTCLIRSHKAAKNCSTSCSPFQQQQLLTGHQNVEHDCQRPSVVQAVGHFSRRDVPACAWS